MNDSSAKGGMGSGAPSPGHSPEATAVPAAQALAATTPEEALRNAYGAAPMAQAQAQAEKAGANAAPANAAAPSKAAGTLGPRMPQRNKAVTSTGARKASAKSSRSRSREFALQALYQHLVGRNSAEAIDSFTRDLSGFHKADAAHYDAVLHGCIATGESMDALITPLLDRKMAEISPIEHACMWMGLYEFQHCLDVPWRVVLNEYIELTKEFGGTDGYKYVNAVLSALAPSLRSDEVAKDTARNGRKVPAPLPCAPAAKRGQP